MVKNDEGLAPSENFGKEIFHTIADESPGMTFISKDRKILYVNNKCEEMMGYTKEEFRSPGFNLISLVSPSSRPAVISSFIMYRDNQEIPPLECTLLTKSGKNLEVIINTKHISHNGKSMILGIVTDITMRKNAENAVRNSERKLKELNKKLSERNKKLKQLALTDSHTGLYNHRFLAKVLEDRLLHAQKENRPFSILMMDIDYFKSINDVYGHQFGDIVLRQFAQEVKRLVRKNNTVVRYGGEEFVIIAPETNRAEAMNLAQRLLEEINLKNFGEGNNRIKIKLSIAAAAYPEDRVIRANEMFELADLILNKAKEFGGNRVYCSLDLKKQSAVNKEKINVKPEIRYLQEKMDRLNKRANQSLIEAIFAFAKTIELKDHYTGEHVERTVHFAVEIAKEIGMSKEEIDYIKQAAILHDLGKVGISEKILLKRAKLTPGEFKLIREHPVIGADIIRPIHLLHDILPFILYHHERWDGSGYPVGLKGEEIPVGARIISIADTYQALISNRPYRKAYSRKDAIEIIKNSFGTHFDPDIAGVFVKIMQREKEM